MALSTVPSPVSPLVTSKTTSVSGSWSRTTVNVAVVPVSSVLPEITEAVKEAVSLSSLVTATVWSASGSKASSLEASLTATVTL